MKAVIYARYSSDNQREESIEGQLRECTVFAEKNDFTVLHHYIDRAVSAKTDNRPEFQNMIRDSAKKLYDRGKTMKEIVTEMTAQGLLAANGKPLTYNTIRNMLHNRRYIGECSFRETDLPDCVPAIVPRDLFDRVQERLERNKKAPARYKAEEEYLLSTKLICGYCGAMLCGESGTGRNGVHHYYKCATVKKHSGDCHKKTVRKRWIEDLVVEELMSFLRDDRTEDAIVDCVMWIQEEENKALPLLEQQLREAETGIENMLRAIQQGVLTKSTKTRLEELEAAKERLELEIAEEKIGNPLLTPKFVHSWVQRFRKLDPKLPSHRKTLIDSFLNAVILFDDKLILSFNYREGSETITFADFSQPDVPAFSAGSDMENVASPKILLARAGRIFSCFFGSPML